MGVSRHAQKTALASGKVPRPRDKGCYVVLYRISNHSIGARYSVSEAIDLLFDDYFRLSDGDLSEEEGDGLYAYFEDRNLSR